MSLSSWFSGSTKAEEAILARLQRLQKDSRDWPSAIAELLEVVPSGTRLRCKDRRVLEVILSLCNVELHPLRRAGPEKTVPLLRATSRLLGARGLYALLPKYSLQCFMQVFHHQRPQAGRLSGGGGAPPPSYAQPPVIAALLRLFLRIVEPASESADDEKAERANKLHFETNGGVDCLAALVESFGPGPRQFLHVEVACLALQLAESLLVTRAHTSDYSLVRHPVQHGRRGSAMAGHRPAMAIFAVPWLAIGTAPQIQPRGHVAAPPEAAHVAILAAF